MSAILEKISTIELEMSRTQKNKATENHLGSLRAKLAQLRRELIAGEQQTKSGKGEGFDVTKTGDCRVGLVGFPSVGKSTLLTKLTGVFSEAASYEFTTLTCVPGVINYRGAKIQLLDLPGIIEGAKDGKGRGRQVISTARTCDVIVVVLDAMKPLTHRRLIEKELDGFGIRLNKQPPQITYTVKDKGGINVLPYKAQTGETAWLDESTIKAILDEYHVKNCEVKIFENCTDEELIDVVEGNRIYTPCVYAVNKIDQITVEELELLDDMKHYVPVSSGKEWNMDGLLETIWEYLSLTRIYTKPKGQNPAYDAPIILKKGKVTVEDFCNSLHKSMVKNFKEANVWGISAKHRPQKVGKDHVLSDEDVVQIIKKI